MTLEALNELSKDQLKEALSKCCGSTTWVQKMSDLFPVSSVESLLEQAASVWFACNEEDWKEAFTHHPKIGDIDSLRKKFASTAAWASGEQSGTAHASEDVLEALSRGNKLYEDKFGYIFIVCATGKSAKEMLEILMQRLHNDPATEIKIAMQEQHKITLLRLEKLLNE
jgi:2-oxo-4-hydroxy-4-carboxy-5-ureidoimidazoline decarboxylase